MAEKSMFDKAVEDVTALQEAAVENAKSVLMEALSSKVDKFIESQMNEAEDKEDKEENTMDENFEMYEAAEDKEGDEDLDESAFVAPVAGAPSVGLEAAEDDESVEDVSEGEEVVELTPESLEAAVSEMLGTAIKEAMVTKGFGDVEDVNANGTGLLDTVSGEKMFNDVEPPASEDQTVKESAKVRAYKKALAEAVKANKELKKVNSYLQENLAKVTLFSSKLLYTTKIFNEAQNLSQKHRMKIVESIDTAESLSEVKKIYKSLSESLKIAGVMSEGKVAGKGGNSAKASRVTTPGSTLIRESIRNEQKADKLDEGYATRLQELAGLIK